jgi:hypothetical protein
MPGKASGGVRKPRFARGRIKWPKNAQALARLSGHQIAAVHSIMTNRRSPDPMELRTTKVA